MTKDAKLDKFSPLSDDRITEIVERSKDKPIKDWLIPIAAKTQEMLGKEKYKILAKQTIDDDGNRKIISKEFLNENLDLVGEFLKDCRLIGTLNEKSEVSRGAYVIGAEGLSLVNEYLATKPNNSDAHEVAVVRNIDFFTGEDDSGSSKTANILMDKKGVHNGWARMLSEDLLQARDKDFNKTYLIETFSSTGGNHFIAVTIRKNVDEDAPLVDFFDPSPGLIRGNIETFQNSIAINFAAQTLVDATLTKVFKEQGLDFDPEKYFNNCEPFQMGGSANCSIFSHEKAYKTAKLSREDHETLLTDHYKFSSPFGGKSEVEVDLEVVRASDSGKVEDPKFNLPPQYMAMSHFKSNVAQYYDDGRMETVDHTRKSGHEETAKERFDRYTKDKDGAAIPNFLIDQKMLRQKYGHLFEIVTSPQFLEMANMERKMEILAVPAFANSAYFPDYISSEMPDNELVKNLVQGCKASEEEKSRGIEDVKGLNDIFPIKIVSAFHDEATNNCHASLYAGERLRQRIESWARENDFGIEVRTENFDAIGFDLSKINPILRNREKITLSIPVSEESFKKIADTNKDRFEAKTPLPRVVEIEASQVNRSQIEQIK